MNISSVQQIPFADLATLPQAPVRAPQSAELVRAVKTVNESNILGDNTELTFVLDRTTHRTLTRVIDRTTHEILMQIPEEYLLRLAEQVTGDTSP